MFRTSQSLALALAASAFCVMASTHADSGPSYDQARWDPIHFKPAIDQATNEDCLACHQDVMERKVRTQTPAGLNWAIGVIVLAMIYYVALTPRLALGMALYVALNLATILALEETGLPLAYVYAGTFVVAWVGQFWGHKVEGARPSFFKDVQFLLIGPLWLLAFLYRRWGWAY